MLESLPVQLFVGTALGFLSGLGIGGGSLLMLWLTLALGVQPAAARGINLLFFLPAAAVSIALHHKQGRVNIRALLPAIAAGCVCAALAAYLSTSLPVEGLKKLFGLLLLATGARELLHK